VDSNLVASTHKPQVNFYSQAIITLSAKNLGYEEVITNGGNFSGLVSTNQSLFNKKNPNISKLFS
jgi:hypothetical protein